MDSHVVRIVCVLAATAMGAAGQTPSPLTVVNAANYVSQVSPGSIATAFGSNLPTDSGTVINVCLPGNPPSGCMAATVFAAYPGQINFLVPDAATGAQVVVQVLYAGTIVATGTVAASSFSPGLFTADNSGTGIFNGQAYDGGQYNAVFSAGAAIVPRAVAPSSGSGPNTLILYGTGWNAASEANVRVSVGGITMTPDYAGAVFVSRTGSTQREDSARARDQRRATGVAPAHLPAYGG